MQRHGPFERARTPFLEGRDGEGMDGWLDGWMDGWMGEEGRTKMDHSNPAAPAADARFYSVDSLMHAGHTIRVYIHSRHTYIHTHMRTVRLQLCTFVCVHD